MSFFDSFFGCTGEGTGDVIPAGQYCVRTDVEQLFGTTNVARWSDLDNDEDATKIEDRITYACEEAYVEINSLLRSTRYTVPFESPYSREIVTLAATFAGIWLYEAKGYNDEEGEARRYAGVRKRFYQRAKAIVMGARVLKTHEPVSINTAPTVVE